MANSTANLVKSIKASFKNISPCLRVGVIMVTNSVFVWSHQALDGAFNQENRQKCKEATGPLIEAVDNLTAFASNPEFASVPAQISPEVCYSTVILFILLFVQKFGDSKCYVIYTFIQKGCILFILELFRKDHATKLIYSVFVWYIHRRT